ncbi:MAG: dTMP kinase [Microbacteriaceae bacterium]|nr:dTMP kinase [Microbacteriaceae bacterium]
MTENGVFIVFEGGDGAGKSTQLRALAAHLAATGREVVCTREPGGTSLGAEIRRLLLHGDEIAPRAEALLYAADRAHHIETLVKPALKRGAIVLQDRYIDSSLAYQGAARALDIDDIAGISAWATGGLQPDLAVVLDLDPTEGAARRQGRGEAADRLEAESLEFHRAVRQGFLDRAAQAPDRYLVLDATAPIAELGAKIAAKTDEILTGKRKSTNF